MFETSVKGIKLLLLLLASMPSFVVCGVGVYNTGDGLLFQQVNDTGEVSSAVFITQRLLTRLAR